MPGTHLLPPNLLKLFAPRAPLPYTRPVDKDIDRVTKKNVDGVGQVLAMLRESGISDDPTTSNSDAMEEGEEPAFTLAEETKGQIRREERKKRKADEFKAAKETCESLPAWFSNTPALCIWSYISAQTSLRKTQKR